MKRFEYFLYRSDAPNPADLRGCLPDNHNCVDCGVDTAPGLPDRHEVEAAFKTQASARCWIDEHSEVYMVRESVWRKTGLEGYGGCLCIGCLEKRIGRRLKPKDFDQAHEFNSMPATPRLRKRRDR